MAAGQYHDPHGIFYGGTELQASYRVLEEWLRQFFVSQHRSPSINDNDEGGTPPPATIATATWLDVHTGLGPSGEDTMIPHGLLRHVVSPKWVEAQIQEWFPDSHHPAASAQGSRVTQGYDQAVGHVGDYFAPLLHNHSVSSTLFVVQEFGTIPMPLVGHALILENSVAMAAVAKAASSSDDETRSAAAVASAAQHQWWAERTVRPAFYPNRPEWRAAVIQRGLRALGQSIRRSSRPIVVAAAAVPDDDTSLV